MHTKVLGAVFFIASVFLLFSCTNEKGSLPASSGKTSEILFVIEKPYWKGLVGDSIRSIFMSEYLVLNQPEPMFTLANIEESDFSKIFEPHRNIIIVDIKPENVKPKFELRKDVWSQPQMVFKLSTATPNEFIEFLSKQKNQIIAYLYENERERMNRSFKREEDTTITNALIKSYGTSLTIPKGYFIAKKLDNFCWIRRETEETSIGILLYFYPYIDTISFNEDYILNLRDSLTQANVPGPSDGSYMQVSRKDVLPVSKKIDFKGKFANETRGLWEVKHNFMGGPFINYTFVDESKNMVVTLDAFIYAPRFEKRDYVIQTESIIYTYQAVR